MGTPLKPAQKMVIFDLDDTLINTRLLKKLRFDIFKNAGYTDEEILTAYEEIYDSGYTPEKHLYALQQIRLNENISSVSDDHLHTEDLVFSDTRQVLEKIKNNPAIRCILLTKGDKISQLKKVTLLTLEHFFDEVWTNAGSKEEFLKTKITPETPFIFINDRASENEKIKAHFPLTTCYLIDRHGIHPAGTAFISLHHILKETGI